MNQMTKILLASTFLNPVIAADPIDREKEIIQIVEKHLLNHPELIERVLKNLEEKKAQEQKAHHKKLIAENKDKIFNNASDPVIGNVNGAIKVAVFLDPYCGHCRKFHEVLDQLGKEPALKDVGVHIKDLPVFGEPSQLAIRGALAAKEQGKYLEFQAAFLKLEAPAKEDWLLQNAKAVGLNVEQFKKDLNSDKIKKLVEATENLAQSLEVAATPTLIVGDLKMAGGLDMDEFKKLIELSQGKDKIEKSGSAPAA